MNVIRLPQKPKILFSKTIAIDGDAEMEDGCRTVAVTIDSDCTGLVKVALIDSDVTKGFEMLDANLNSDVRYSGRYRVNSGRGADRPKSTRMTLAV